MKIVCQSCSAKYSIADDKVQGKKVFKIKCKKCGEDILVRGETEAPAAAGGADQFSEDEATRVVSPESGDATWHAVVNGEQQGPFSIPQLRDLMANASIDPETYVWRDGFTDWKPMREVPELFTALGSAMPAAEAAAPAPAAPGGGDQLFASAPAAASPASDGGLFGGPRPAAGGGLFGAAAGEAKARAGSKASAGADLFGAESKPAFGGGGGGGEEEVSSSAPAASSAATGARNENSVLFSLASLQQVAGATTAAKVSEPGAAGKTNGDMSGLIDIKSMANSIGGSAKSKALDDILTVGGGGAISSPLAAPVLAPIPAPTSAMVEPEKSSGTNKTVLFAVIAVAVILAGGGVAAAFLLKGNQQPQQVVVQQAPAPPPATPNPANTPPATVQTPPATGTPPVAANTAGTATPPATGTAGTAPAAGSESGSTRERPSGGSRSARERPTGSSTSSSTSSTSTASSNTASAPSGGSCAQRCRGDIDCLLRCGTQGPAAAANRPPPPSGGGDGPETPSRNDVITAMNGVRSAVTACGQGMTGTAQVSVTFASSGRVTTANVSPPFAGTPAGSCIARAVRSASVPSFTRPTFTVNFPFAIH